MGLFDSGMPARNMQQNFLKNRWSVTPVCFLACWGYLVLHDLLTTTLQHGTFVPTSSHMLKGHTDTVTGLRFHQPQGTISVSTAMDSTVRLWDTRPFTTLPTRCEMVYVGAPHGFEKSLLRPCFSPDESMIACGSSDRTVTIWDRRSGEIRYKLPGHTGTVNQVDWHPKEPIILTGSADQTLFLGEIDPDMR